GNSIPVNIDNPFLSAQARDIFTAQGISNFYLSRAVLDITPDNNAVHSEGTTERVVVALDGDFALGERNYYWNVAGNYGHSGGNIERIGIYEERFRYASDVVSGPGGEPMCRITRDNPGSADPAIAQCRPLNLFGANNAD